MLVQRLVRPDSADLWTVCNGDGAIVPVDQFLSSLTSQDLTPNTVKAYAHDLKDWFSYLEGQGLDWREVRLEDISEFTTWLRVPPKDRDNYLTNAQANKPCSPSTINRKLTAISRFYSFHAATGVDLGDISVYLNPTRRQLEWRQFRHYITNGEPGWHKDTRHKPVLVTAPQMQAILDNSTRLRDRFLWTLLADTGIRIGEALGLRHHDLSVENRQLTVVRRINNANRAVARSLEPRSIPISGKTLRLYTAYLNDELGEINSDYIFINLWNGVVGSPWTYSAVYDLVTRLRRAIGFEFDPHSLRHTYAVRLLRLGTPMETVSELLGHTSVATTAAIYGSLATEYTDALGSLRFTYR